MSQATTPLRTTTVGSLPKPDYLTHARGQRARGELSQEELDDLARKATRDWIAFQEEIVEFGALDVHDRFHCS